MIFCMLAATLLLTTAGPAARRPYSVAWASADSMSRGAKRALVRIGDQDYGLTLAIASPRASELVRLDPPSPWRVRDRADLVPIISRALAESDSLDYLAYNWVANLVLPHIDSPLAAAAYAKLRWESGPQPERSIGFLKQLSPDDALPQPIWTSFAADPSVLPLLKAHIGASGPQGSIDTYALSVLGMSNDPRALQAVREAFRAKPERSARYAYAVLTYQPSVRTRTFLMSEILPGLSAQRPNDGFFSLEVWRWLAQPGNWESLGYYDSTQVLGHRFVETVLYQPDFPSVLFGRPGVGGKGSTEWAEGWYGWGRTFLEACAQLGDSVQASRLEQALHPTESWMTDEQARKDWDSHYFTGWWSFEDMIESYKKSKENALVLMRQRDPRWFTPR